MRKLGYLGFIGFVGFLGFLPNAQVVFWALAAFVLFVFFLLPQQGGKPGRD